MRRICAIFGLALGLIISSAKVLSAATAEPAPDQTAKPVVVVPQTELEKAFEKTMTNAVLVGHYTAGKSDKGDKEDRYTIVSVSKLFGETWLFMARIQFGGKDVTVPIPLPVKWAGDTPMITVTDVNFPGLGTYTARVMIYHDQYAGTWSGGTHGGHLWGRIEHPAIEKKPDDVAGENPKPEVRKPNQ